MKKFFRLFNLVIRPVVNYGVGRDINYRDPQMVGKFIKICSDLESPRVLELGTKRSQESRSTKHSDWIPHASEFLGTDIQDGIDVDFVADAHSLSNTIGEEQFDVIISCSTFEHFKYPHLAAHQILKTLKIGGYLFIQTHQSFPLHAFPYDYFRFSKEALSGLFGTKMGFSVTEVDYEFPAKIYSKRDSKSCTALAYLNVNLIGRKLSKTPDAYCYELDAPLRQPENIGSPVFQK